MGFLVNSSSGWRSSGCSVVLTVLVVLPVVIVIVVASSSSPIFLPVLFDGIVDAADDDDCWELGQKLAECVPLPSRGLWLAFSQLQEDWRHKRDIHSLFSHAQLQFDYLNPAAENSTDEINLSADQSISDPK